MRIRTIKPAFWTNEKMAVLPDFARLLAIGLLNYADDHGFFWANSLMIRGSLFPFEEDSSKVRKGLAQLEAEGFIRLGKTADGREVGEVVNFKKHQRVDKPYASEIQPLAIFADRSKNDTVTIVDESALYRKGKEEEGNGKDLAPPPAPRERNVLIDALATTEGTPLNQLTTLVCKRLGTALKEIRSATPDVTPDEIARRAKNYPTHFEDATISANALAKWWGRCDSPGLLGKGVNGKCSSYA